MSCLLFEIYPHPRILQDSLSTVLNLTSLRLWSVMLDLEHQDEDAAGAVADFPALPAEITRWLSDSCLAEMTKQHS